MIDLDHRLGDHARVSQSPAGGHRPIPGGYDVFGPQEHGFAVTRASRHRPNHQRETHMRCDRGQLVHRSGEPERRGR